MLVCRRRGDYARKWKISAAFNVSQKDRAPLELFRETLGCGTIRKAGNGGWYWEVNRLPEIASRIVPFFERFPLIGKKAADFERFRRAVALLSRGVLSDDDYAAVLALRERMNGGGKRRYSAARILRDYTPTLPLESAEG
jgi:LAGLIDADG DNA endonuclease family protein